MLAALWWGSLTALGFLVVPLLFQHLPSPAAAGAMAAKLFTAQTWLSVGCTFLILLISNKKEPLVTVSIANSAIKYVVLGLLLAVLVEFGVSAQISTARVTGGNLRLWHAVGSGMYLGQWLCAGWVLWRLSATGARPNRS